MEIGTIKQLTVTNRITEVVPVGGVYLTESMRRALLQTLAQLVRLFPEETRKILMRIKAEEALK